MDITKLSPSQMIDYVLSDMTGTHDRIFQEDPATTLAPVIIAFNAQGQVARMPVGGFMRSDQGKAVLGELVPKLFDQTGIVCYGFASESWMVIPQSDTVALRPSKSESRIEIVMTIVRHREGGLRVSVREMVRDYTHGGVTELRANEQVTALFNSPGTLTGTFGNLFEAPRGPSYDDMKRELEKTGQ